MRALFKQLVFVAVGCAAAATHWAVAVGCVELAAAAPLVANLVGWLVAFAVSFIDTTGLRSAIVAYPGR